jgi:hypothetical protein
VPPSPPIHTSSSSNNFVRLPHSTGHGQIRASFGGVRLRRVTAPPPLALAPPSRATAATSLVPYAQIPTPGAGGRGQNARSLSQPLLLLLDSLPLPPPYADLAATSHTIPPSFGFLQLSPPLPSPTPVKREAFTLPEGFRSNTDAAAFDDLVNSYMDLDGLDLLNSSDDRDSRASGTRESSEKEADSKSTSMERKDGAKSRHYHSFPWTTSWGSSTWPLVMNRPSCCCPLLAPTSHGLAVAPSKVTLCHCLIWSLPMGSTLRLRRENHGK